MNSNLIKISNVSFGYKKGNINIKNLNIAINSYGIYGLLGHNGAGKTTLFKILLGLIQNYTGNVTFNSSLLYSKNKPSISYMPENNGLYEDLTISQNLIFRGLSNGLNKDEIQTESEILLKKFLLHNKINEKVSNLSNGMKKKVALIATLITNPKIILLDEPTNGIDPESLLDIITIIKELKNRNCIVLITSHDLHFIEQITKYVYILENGEIVYSGDISDNNSSLLSMYIDKLKKYREGESNVD